MFSQIKKSIFVIFCCASCCRVNAQVPVEFELSYHKVDDLIKFNVVAQDIEEYEPVSALTLEFINHSDDDSVVLGQALTNKDGIAILDSVPVSRIKLNKDNLMQFSISVLADNRFTATENMFEFKDVRLDIDSDGQSPHGVLTVRAAERLSSGELEPIEDLDLYVYVPRMYGLLPVGEIYTEEGGIGSLKFPCLLYTSPSPRD